jgi:ribose 5-phosphate isomerase
VAVRTRLTRTMPRSLTVRSSREKEVVAETAAKLVDGGMRVGIGTGTTIARLLPLLPARGVVYVATSPGTEAAAGRLGLNVQPFEVPDRLDLALDSADQVGPTGWLVKGRGRAHTREKVVAAAAERFVVLVSSDKLVPQLTAPVPLELLAFGSRGHASLALVGDQAAVRTRWSASESSRPRDEDRLFLAAASRLLPRVGSPMGPS